MTEEDHILIEKYLKGSLSKNEEASFLERLDSDALFKEIFEFEQQAYNTLNEDAWSYVGNKSSDVQEYRRLLDEGDMKDLKLTLDKVNSSQSDTSNKSKRTPFYYLAAASVVVFMAFQFFFNQGVSNQDLYDNYINHEDLPSFATRGSGDDVEGELVKAQQLFENQDYKSSLTIFEPILETEKNNASLYLYTAIAQSELNLYKKAEVTFDNLINNSSIDGSAGHWYKALLYLKQDKVEDAKSTLNYIVENSLYNNSKAKELLSKLVDE